MSSDPVVDAKLIPDRDPDAALLASLTDPDLRARHAAVKDLAALSLPARGAWIAVAWAALDAEPDSEVAADLLRLLGTADRLGQVPLEAHLDAGGPAMRRSATRSLFRAFDDATLFAAAFSGLLNPHRRSLASTLHEMASSDGARVCGTLTRCLYSQDPFVQRVGLAALLEVPEEVARPLLAQFPEELTLPESAGQSKEVNSTFEMRRFLRNQNVAYFPLRLLGQGGMGAVWLSRDIKRPPRLAALKFMRATDGRQDPDLERRFEREARVPLLLNHPGLLRVIDFGQQPELHWIDVDYIQGHNLQDLLDRVGMLDWTNVVWAAMQVADALDYLHRKRIIHRDLKPANLFIARDPHRVVLGDFGLVQIEDEQLQAEVPNYTPTQAHMILGTVGYMSPEQATSSPLDGRSDLFSLGAVMYRALAGKLPYRGSSFGEYIRAINSPKPPDPLDASIPRPVADIVMRLLARAPEERFLSAAKVVEGLRAVTQGGTAHTDQTISYAATGGEADPASLARSMGGSIIGASRQSGVLPAATTPIAPTIAAPAPPAAPASRGPPTLPPGSRLTSGVTGVPASSGPVPPHAPGSVRDAIAPPDARNRRDRLNDAFVSDFKAVGAPSAPALRAEPGRPENAFPDEPPVQARPPPRSPTPPPPRPAIPQENPGMTGPHSGGSNSGRVARPISEAKFDIKQAPPPAMWDPLSGSGPPRVPPEAGDWCPTCHAPTRSQVEGCLTCRYRLMPWTPWVMGWVFTVLAVWFIAPYVLMHAQPYVPQAPTLSPPFGTHIICALVGVGLYLIARGIGRVANWAYVAGTLLVWLVGVGGAGAALALEKATPETLPPEILPALSRLVLIDFGSYTPDLLLRILREQFHGGLRMTGCAALLLGIALLGGEVRSHFRRDWTLVAIASGLFALGLAVGAPAYMLYLRWNGLPIP